MNFAHYLKEAEEKLKKSDKLEGKKEFNPLKLEIGDLYEGGYFVGYVNDMTEHYALFVAPNETKEIKERFKFKVKPGSTINADSVIDGKMNSDAMEKSGISDHPAAEYCSSLTLNGHSDWYLPSIQELEMCYRAFKPSVDKNKIDSKWNTKGNGYNKFSIPVGDAYTETHPKQTQLKRFKEFESQAFSINCLYWSSTEYDVHSALCFSFKDGLSEPNNKDASYCVRPVRRKKL